MTFSDLWLLFLLCKLHLLITIVSLQKPIEKMTPDSELHMRGGGVVGGWSV
jgi:hypothetical protein